MSQTASLSTPTIPRPDAPSQQTGEQVTAVVPITLRAANGFIAAHHRHAAPTQGCKFACGLERLGQLVGVVVCGRPVARGADDGRTAEITRLALDPALAAKNDASRLYGAARRVARSMGYRTVITYTLENESGVSLRAAGFAPTAKVYGRQWDCQSRHRGNRPATPDRVRWES